MLVEHTTTTTSLYLYCKTTLLLDVQGMTRPSSSTTLTHASPTLSRTNVEPPREDAQAAVHVYSRTCLGLKVLTCKFHALRNACSGLTPLRAIAICRRPSPSSTEETRVGDSKREREIEGETVGSLMISSRSRSLACDLEKLLVSCLFSNWDHSETTAVHTLMVEEIRALHGYTLACSAWRESAFEDTKT